MSCECKDNCQCNRTCEDNKMGFIACNASGPFQPNDFNCKNCGCINDEQIIIKGVCSEDKLKAMLGPTDKTWTELFIPEVLCIPCQKPDVEKVISVTSRVQIISQRVVETPVPPTNDPDVTNNEGTNLTGKKLIIEGVLRQKVVYTADVPEQSVHSAHFDVPFSTFIIVPRDTLLTAKFKIEPCIEDIFICRVNKRQIFKNITLFIKATPLVCS